MPALARAGRRAYAVDLPGLGDSDRPVGGYDVATIAAGISELIGRLGIGDPVDVVAHDVGAWVAHPLAVEHPTAVRSLTLVDAAIPGVTALPTGIPDEETNRRSWHFGFNRLPELPELLLSGRERPFLKWLFESKSVRRAAFDDVALDEYARILSAPGAIDAGLRYYQEALSEEGLERARQRASVPLRMPVLTVGGAQGVGSLLEQTLAGTATDLRGLVIENCGHYVPEECPENLAEALLGFWQSC
jgi:pimeloyl-ACP methyl ester carboxylesterase